MTTRRAIIHNPTSPDSQRRRQFLLDSITKSGLEWAEELEENRIVITYRGQLKPSRITGRKTALPPPLSLEKCLKSRHVCEPDEIEYWDEMIALSAGREGVRVAQIRIRSTWQSAQWAECWAVLVSDHLAVNRGEGCWNVTHLVTGLAAGSASSLKEAVRVARDVAHWPEWAALRGKDDITPDFRRKASSAFKEVAA
jgi:hypothetical protein